MSNEIQKLKPVERSLYRRVFMARIEGGQSPEAAHRHGLNAVKMWEGVGAFNEESAPSTSEEKRLAAGFRAWAASWLDSNIEINESVPKLVESFLNDEIEIAEFRRRLGLDRDSSG